MTKKAWIHILEWSVAAAAYVYLVYELATYEHYDLVAASLRAMGWREWAALGLSVGLMPVNMGLEAWRWKTLVPMSFREANRQVYYSKLAGLITPWRLGEYPARGVLMSEGAEEKSGGEIMKRVIAMGVVGSATMTMAIVIAGAVALGFSPTVVAQLGGSYLYALAGVVAVLGAALALAPAWLQKWFWGREQERHTSSLIWRSLGQSIVRLGCWCVQLALVLYALGGLGSLGGPEIIGTCAIYYLLVTVTPNIPIVEAGVRGAWAMLLFGTPNAALAGVLLWVINTLLPCAIWPCWRTKTA